MFDKKTRYAIIGLARSGIAAAYKIRELGGTAFLSDMKSADDIPQSNQLMNDFECEFGNHSEKLLDFQTWIISPGVPLNSPVIKLGIKNNKYMISELEFGYQIKHPDNRIIAVTGSNGKSTTSSLIAHIISSSGRKSIFAGNIGDAMCGFPIEKPGYDFIVLEVSSFQLDLIDTFKPDYALLLNITPDHLNRYDSFMDYAMAKAKIFKNQTCNDFAIINGDDPVVKKIDLSLKSQLRVFSMNRKSSLYTPDVWFEKSNIFINNSSLIFDVKDMQIRGPHNVANAMASILACSAAGLTTEEIFNGLRSFVSLNHRLQYIDTVNGVEFYNDSKATNTDSVKYALLSFEKPIRIIMGGSDKGEDFAVLTDLLKQKSKKVYITGATSSKMEIAWSNTINTETIQDFAQCIKKAFEDSAPGDVIVLSPACASYDKFKNFEHRGEVFINIVKSIADSYEKAQ